MLKIAWHDRLRDTSGFYLMEPILVDLPWQTAPHYQEKPHYQKMARILRASKKKCRFENITVWWILKVTPVNELSHPQSCQFLTAQTGEKWFAQ